MPELEENEQSENENQQQETNNEKKKRKPVESMFSFQLPDQIKREILTYVGSKKKYSTLAEFLRISAMEQLKREKGMASLKAEDLANLISIMMQKEREQQALVVK